MKKIMTLAAMFAAVMMSFTACSPDDTKPQDKPNTEQDGNEDEGKEDEYVSPITIDGEFADWDALDASKVATAECATEAKLTALKSVKVYADAMFINILIEVDADQIAAACPIDIYFNADNSANTAANNWTNQGGQDCLLEGGYFDGTAVSSFDPGCYPYTGAEDVVEWAWDVENPLIAEGSGLASGAGTVAKYELAIMTEMLAGVVDLADTFAMGITVSQDWEPVGLLPNADVTEDNTNGAAPFLTVTINK